MLDSDEEIEAKMNFGHDKDDGSAGDYFLFQSLSDKSLYKLTLTGEEERLYTIPHLCYRLQATYLNYREEAVVGLSQNQRMYINDKVFSNECTSFTLA